MWEPFQWEGLKPNPVIGVDEVGRGCLAGEVYAAAVILGPKFPQGLTDSKKLTAKKRKLLAEEIYHSCQVGVGTASLEEIENINILHAALLAMKRAVLNLGVTKGHIIVDGNKKIPNLDQFVQTTLVKGDLRATPVAAASIVAKVKRDADISAMALKYPGYGFENHKGYGTPAHKLAIEQQGPCAIHRRTFAGVKEYLQP